MSPNEALDELSSLYIRNKEKGFRLQKTVALTKKQKR
jgi:hypothetical protein